MRLLLLCVLATPALADGSPKPPITLAQLKTIDCYCTDKQRNRIELGESICLFVDGRAFMAQCQMSLNVPMWRKTREGCETSSLPQSRDPARDPG
jgi:hypothetical protein